MTPQQTKFLDALVEFLTTGEAAHSVHLELGLPSSVAWSKLRATTPLFGYHPGEKDKARAREQLMDMFGWTAPPKRVEADGVYPPPCPDCGTIMKREGKYYYTQCPHTWSMEAEDTDPQRTLGS